jgi:hypothetical protein
MSKDIERNEQASIFVADRPRKRKWFSKIETRDDALKVIKEVSLTFLGLAGLQLALMVFVLRQYAVVYDVAVIVLGVFFLWRFKSRAAAVLLLLLAGAELGVTVANRAGAAVGGGNNIFLGLVMLWAGIRAVQASFKLRSLAAAASAKGLIRT